MTKNFCVICLGEILFDCLADQIGRSQSKVESWTSYPGGAPANVACALAKLGSSAAFIGAVGQDDAGKELVKVLESVGVDTTGVQYHSTAPTRQVYVLRSESGDRTFAGFGDKSPSEFADAFLDASKLPVELFEAADFLVLGTLELAYPKTRKAVFRALELAEQHNVKTVLDVNWRPRFWEDPNDALPYINKLWEHIDFLKLSDDEAQWLFKTTDAGAIANRLETVEGVLVTAGEKQISYYLSESEGKIAPFPVKVQDTTGAGDGFVAGLIHQLCQHKISSLKQPEIAKQVVTYATAVGSLITTKPGAIAAQPTAAEVDEFLKNQLSKSS